MSKNDISTVRGADGTALPRLAVSARDAAEMIGVSPSTLRNWRCAGRGPRPVSLSRSQVIYRVSDLVEWLDAEAAKAVA